MINFSENIKSVLSVDVDSNEAEIASNIVFMAVLVIAVIIIGGWLSTALINKGADVASCIENASSSGLSNADAKAKCAGGEHKEKNSFTKDGEYSSRFATGG